MQLERITAGATLNFQTVVDDYAPADGWTLNYRLVPFGSGTPITMQGQASADGQAHQVQIAANVTAGYAPGDYSWHSWVTKAAEVYDVGSGQITVLPDPRQATSGYDNRTPAAKALADCEAAMATFNATGGKVKKYEIAGRSMEFQTIGDLMQLHSFWKLKVAAEGTSASVAAGLGNPRNLHVRFVRPA